MLVVSTYWSDSRENYGPTLPPPKHTQHLLMVPCACGVVTIARNATKSFLSLASKDLIPTKKLRVSCQLPMFLVKLPHVSLTPKPRDLKTRTTSSPSAPLQCFIWSRSRCLRHTCCLTDLYGGINSRAGLHRDNRQHHTREGGGNVYAGRSKWTLLTLCC